MDILDAEVLRTPRTREQVIAESYGYIDRMNDIHTRLIEVFDEQIANLQGVAPVAAILNLHKHKEVLIAVREQDNLRIRHLIQTLENCNG